MVREPSDHVTAISWWPGMTLKDALKHRRGGELRLAVHFWHGSDRTTFQAKALMEEQTLKQFLHPDDVIVLGVIDQPRQRRVESLPAVTGALQHR